MFPVLYKLHPQSPSSFRRRARNKLVSTDNRQPSATLVGALWSPQASFPPAPRELRDTREAEACVSTVSAAGPPCLQGAWRARPGALTLPVCPLQPELRGQTPPAPAQLPCPPDPGFEEQSRSASCKQGAPPHLPGEWRTPHIRGSSGETVGLPSPGSRLPGRAGMCSHPPHVLSFLGGHSAAFLGPHQEDLPGSRETRACIPALQVTLSYAPGSRNPIHGSPAWPPHPTEQESAWGSHTSWKHSSSHEFPQVSGENRFFILADT